MSIITDLNAVRRNVQATGNRVTSFHFPEQDMVAVINELAEHLAPMFDLQAGGRPSARDIEKAIRAGQMKLMGIRIEACKFQRVPGVRNSYGNDPFTDHMRRRGFM